MQEPKGAGKTNVRSQRTQLLSTGNYYLQRKLLFPMVCAGAKGSWQDKCSLPKNASQEEAIEFFKGMGFKTEQMKWDEDGGLKLINYHPGFVKDPQTGQDVWWNIIHTGSLKAGDGTAFPKKMVQVGLFWQCIRFSSAGRSLLAMY